VGNFSSQTLQQHLVENPGCNGEGSANDINGKLGNNHTHCLMHNLSPSTTDHLVHYLSALNVSVTKKYNVGHKKSFRQPLSVLNNLYNYACP